MLYQVGGYRQEGNVKAARGYGIYRIVACELQSLRCFIIVDNAVDVDSYCTTVHFTFPVALQFRDRYSTTVRYFDRTSMM